MISLKKVTKLFGSKVVVSEVSFEARNGDIVGFVGPNGAGKTTTMRIICGLLHPSSGTVRVFNEEPISARLTLLKRIGYLPENNPLPLDMTVQAYLEYIAAIKNEKNLLSLAEEVRIENVYQKRIEQLSRGYRQRIGLAAALCGKPDILLLDEPTSGLDPIEQDVIKDLIAQRSKRQTVIFSTHILTEIEDIANRLLIINKGSLLFDGPKPKGRGSVEVLFKKTIKKHL